MRSPRRARLYPRPRTLRHNSSRMWPPAFKRRSSTCWSRSPWPPCATGFRRLCVGGGVAANARFREQMTARCQQAEIELHIAPLSLCTDNAVMGAIAIERLKAGLTESLDLDIMPGLVR